MSGPTSRFDLVAELEQLRGVPHADHHVAKTLVRTTDLRVVLIAMDAGADIASHHTDAAITLQIFDGRICLTCPGSELDLCAGTVTKLDRGVRHALHAIERSSVLLSIAWSGHHRDCVTARARDGRSRSSRPALGE